MVILFGYEIFKVRLNIPFCYCISMSSRLPDIPKPIGHIVILIVSIIILVPLYIFVFATCSGQACYAIGSVIAVVGVVDVITICDLITDQHKPF